MPKSVVGRSGLTVAVDGDTAACGLHRAEERQSERALA